MSALVRDGRGTPISPWLVKTAGERLDFMVGEIGYQSGPPLHIHQTQEDTFYVLDGVLTVQSGDDILELHPGDFVTVPPGVAHTFDNLRDDQPVRAINIMTPGCYDTALREFNMIDATDVRAAQEVGDRYGVQIVGPALHMRIEAAEATDAD